MNKKQQEKTIEYLKHKLKARKQVLLPKFKKGEKGDEDKLEYAKQLNRGRIKKEGVESDGRYQVTGIIKTNKGIKNIRLVNNDPLEAHRDLATLNNEDWIDG